MSIIEGGVFKCSIHGEGNDFETEDPAAWEAHKVETPHFLEGTFPCIYCQHPTKAEPQTIQYRGLAKPVTAVCDQCAGDNNIRATSRRIVLEDTNNASSTTAKTQRSKGARSQ